MHVTQMPLQEFVLIICYCSVSIEKAYIYNVVVRSASSEEVVELVNRKDSFHLIQQSNSSTERATFAHTISRTLTGED